jgi:peptidoglycan/LPS O-acetylase OafA/YrhL
MWSISVEEQFYVFSPWIVKYLNRKMLYGFCALLILVANAWLYWLTSTGHTSHQSTFNSLVQFECFAAGILLCLALKGQTPRMASWQRPILLVCAWLCWFLATYPMQTRFDTNRNPGFWPLMSGYALASLGSVLILIAFLGMDSKWLPGWAIYLGRISFGLYVYHEFVIYAMHRLLVGRLAPLGSILPVKFALDLGTTILVAALSYRYFETPFLKMKKRHSVIESQPISGTR